MFLSNKLITEMQQRAKRFLLQQDIYKNTHLDICKDNYVYDLIPRKPYILRQLKRTN